MNLANLSLFFPLILAIHNAEEFFRYDDFVRDYHGRIAARFLRRPVIRNAVVLLTIVASIVCFFAWISRNEVLTDTFVVATFGLMLNALGHVAMSLRRKMVTPGTVSAVVLVLPYSAVVLVTLRAATDASWSYVLRMAGLGALLIPLAVVLFLLLGYTAWMLQRRLGLERDA